jgi:hypothetical protein
MTLLVGQVTNRIITLDTYRIEGINSLRISLVLL